MNYFLEKCIHALAENVQVLSIPETSLVFKAFEYIFPIASWGRIDWEKIEKKQYYPTLEDVQKKINDYFPIADRIVFIIWDEASLPAIKVNLEHIFKILYDLRAVSFNMWIFCPRSKHAIEFYGDGVTLGIGKDIYKELQNTYEELREAKIESSHQFQGEYKNVFDDIIAKGNAIANIAYKLINHEQLTDSEASLLQTTYLTKSAWWINNRAIPLVKVSLMLEYAKILEKCKSLCNGMIIYKKVLDLEKNS